MEASNQTAGADQSRKSTLAGRRPRNGRQQKEPGPWRTIWSLALVILVIGWYITGSITWGYKSRWMNPRFVRHSLFDANPSTVHLTEAELAQYNGVDATKPIYLAVDGMVFDVSSKPDTYGPIGAYQFFSGRDAARAFATGCFKTDLTHDLRGLSDADLASVKSWQKFFANNVQYWHVGFVDHPPLEGDPPPPCRAAQKPH